MFLEWTDKLSNGVFAAVKWVMTLFSVVITSGFILVLES